MATEALLTSEPMTDEQRKQLTRLAEDAMAEALKEVHPNHVEAQRIHLRGNDIVNAIIDKVRELSTCGKFEDEEVASNCGYFSGYRKPRQICEQVSLLRQIFPGLGLADECLARGACPQCAEGWFAIPRWEAIASTYAAAVEMVLAEIDMRCGGKFVSYREGKLADRYLRQTTATRAAFRLVADEQRGCDILAVPAQFGILHHGRSVRRAREMMRSNEFGLGAFAVGIMLLTHPERLQHYDDLWIDCAGDEYSPDGDGNFENAPYFGLYGGWTKFDAGFLDDANDRYGSASGFSCH